VLAQILPQSHLASTHAAHEPNDSRDQNLFEKLILRACSARKINFSNLEKRMMGMGLCPIPIILLPKMP
jgi:hypothetical protein